MASSESPTLIQEYSQVFTTLHAGKRQLIQWGADAVTLNRYIIDAARATGETNPQPVLQTIDISQVTEGETEQERTRYCSDTLKNLISLQEQVSVLQKSARESGISGGLLTIIGQAANQSPDDHGASVLKQLSELVGNKDTKDATDTKTESPKADVVADVLVQESAANDVDRLDDERRTALQQLAFAVRKHWLSLLVDATVCSAVTAVAISLVI